MNSSKIAIVDDDQDIRQAMVDVLELEGVPSLAFSNGSEALDFFKKKGCQDIALIIVDLMMPVMDGISFIKAYRLLGPDYQNTPIVVASAKGGILPPEIQSEVRSHLKKPFELEILTDLIGAHSKV